MAGETATMTNPPMSTADRHRRFRSGCLGSQCRALRHRSRRAGPPGAAVRIPERARPTAAAAADPGLGRDGDGGHDRYPAGGRRFDALPGAAAAGARRHDVRHRGVVAAGRAGGEQPHAGTRDRRDPGARGGVAGELVGDPARAAPGRPHGRDRGRDCRRRPQPPRAGRRSRHGAGPAGNRAQ